MCHRYVSFWKYPFPVLLHDLYRSQIFPSSTFFFLYNKFVPKSEDKNGTKVSSVWFGLNSYNNQYKDLFRKRQSRCLMMIISWCKPPMALRGLTNWLFLFLLLFHFLYSPKSTVIFLSLLSTVSLSLHPNFSASNRSVHCPYLVPTRGLIVGLMVMIIAVTDFPIISCTKRLLKCTYCCDLISTQEQEMSVCVCGCVCVCERERIKLVSGESVCWALLCTFPCLHSWFLCF